MSKPPLALFDAHLHIIDPRFPLIPNQGYLPQPFTCDAYLARMSDYQLSGGAVVSGSFQGFDQSYLLDALQRLGPGFVGVTQLPQTITDAQLHQLHQGGVCAVRFNLFRGGSDQLRYMVALAQRVHDLHGWHAELYLDASNIDELTPKLKSLPTYSIDHLGMRRAGLPALCRLAEQGARVKATGFGRLDFPAEEALRSLYAANPASLMFGSDLPSTRAPRPYRDEDLALIFDTLGDAAARQVVLDNAQHFYRTLDKR